MADFKYVDGKDCAAGDAEEVKKLRPAEAMN